MAAHTEAKQRSSNALPYTARESTTWFVQILYGPTPTG